MCTDEFGKDFYFLLRHEENSSRELGGCCCVCRTEQILESSIRSIDIRSILQSYHVVRGVRAYPSQMKISSHSLENPTLEHKHRYTQKAEGRSAQSQKTLYGVFTKESHVNVKTCQILVTVPECLELLLLSAQNVNWIRRIRYVVFDEVRSVRARSARISIIPLCHLISMIALFYTRITRKSRERQHSNAYSNITIEHRYTVSR